MTFTAGPRLARLGRLLCLSFANEFEMLAWHLLLLHCLFCICENDSNIIGQALDHSCFAPVRTFTEGRKAYNVSNINGDLSCRQQTSLDKQTVPNWQQMFALESSTAFAQASGMDFRSGLCWLEFHMWWRPNCCRIVRRWLATPGHTLGSGTRTGSVLRFSDPSRQG